jgi:hypothetical protein
LLQNEIRTKQQKKNQQKGDVHERDKYNPAEIIGRCSGEFHAGAKGLLTANDYQRRNPNKEWTMTNNGWQPSPLFEARHLGFVIFIDPGVLPFRAPSHPVAES